MSLIEIPENPLHFFKKKFLFSVVLFLITGSVCCGIFFKDSLIFRDEPLSQGRGTIFYDKLRTNNDYILLDVYPRQGVFFCSVIDRNGLEMLRFPGVFCSILRDGSILSKGPLELTKINSYKDILWKRNIDAHHDIYEDQGSGEIFTLIWEEVKESNLQVEEVVGLRKDGEPFFNWRVLDHLDELSVACRQKIVPFFDSFKNRNILTHLNSIQILENNSIEQSIPAFKKGNILVSCNFCSMIFIIDRNSKKIVWSYKLYEYIDDAEMVHSARLLKTGNILFFHNNANKNLSKNEYGFSEVYKLNPLTNALVWKYRARTQNRFFASHLGSAFESEDSNVLIAHRANGGGVFEVTQQGRVVWEWTNALDNQNYAGEIYRAQKIERKLMQPFIDNWPQSEAFFNY